MKKEVLTIIFALVCGVILTNCNSNMELDDNEYSINNENIKSISSNGVVSHEYHYDSSGRIVEENCRVYFQKYIYGANGRLEKVESAFDRTMYSSTWHEPRTEFMTSKNSEVENYRLYFYDKTGMLSKIENYFKATGENFECRSLQSFEFKGTNITKVNYHEPSGKITQYYVYSYDKNGNVTKEKQYSNLTVSNELLRETTYQYDNYNNPYRIFSMLCSPGLWSNTNNIIETYSTLFYDVQGIDKNSHSKTAYKYNKDGYPVKEITGDGEFDYHY